VTLRFVPQEELWPLVDRAFQLHSREVRTLVPSAQVEHVGATATPGALTKGDLDLLVSVESHTFPAAVDALGERYDLEQRENWTETFASFAEAGDLPVGIQLVVAGSDIEVAFRSLRRLFRTRPALLEQSNALKRRFEGGDPAAYARAKQELLEAQLRELDPGRFGRGTWPWPTVTPADRSGRAP
jgi:GrpB-like predicted nucleotidyltransferase (UPF0157 family)